MAARDIGTIIVVIHSAVHPIECDEHKMPYAPVVLLIDCIRNSQFPLNQIVHFMIIQIVLCI